MSRIGAHTSIAGGLSLSIERAHAIGADTLQIFAKSPRGWSFPTYPQEEYDRVMELRKKLGITGGLIHSNYLANLSKPFAECQTDIKSIIHDFEVAHHTGFEAINVHVGKGKWFADIHEAYRNMADNVAYILKHNKEQWYKPLFLFEITAGQGSELGSRIAELGEFYNGYLKDLPIAFCFDTAHARGGGNDLRNRDDILAERDKHIGLDKLYSFHLNDSKALLGSHLDRHAPLGKGAIGLAAFVPLIQRAAKNDRPIFLETPEPERRAEEITMIRKIMDGDTKRIKEFHDTHYGSQLLKKFNGQQDALF